MVRWSSVVVIALVAASQDGVFGARLPQRRSLSAQLPVKRLRHVRGKNATVVYSKLLPLQSKTGQEKDGHVTENDVGRAESPQKQDGHVTENDVGRAESPQKQDGHVTENDVSKTDSPQKGKDEEKDFHPDDVTPTKADMEGKLVSTTTCTSPRCQVTPFCSYNHSEISCSCAEEVENESEAEVNCTLYNLAAIFDVFHEDATVTSVCVVTQFLSLYELDCHIKGVEGLTYLIRVERALGWGEVPRGGGEDEGQKGGEVAAPQGQGMEHLNACLLQLQLQSQEVLSEDDWMDSTLKTAITTSGIVISVFMIIFIFYSCKAL